MKREEYYLGAEGEENYIDWKAVGKDAGFLRTVVSEILNKNFIDPQEAIRTEAVAAFRESRPSRAFNPESNYKWVKANLRSLRSIGQIAKFCSENHLDFLNEKELKACAEQNLKSKSPKNQVGTPVIN